MEDFIARAAAVKPSARQIAWQETEFNAFIHFGLNTFTNREWGRGTEDPHIFNPVQLDANQWVNACKSAGMKGLILTCKHHDGFCLWPSKLTDYSVKNSPWKNGAGDVVRETAEACRAGGLKFGLYLSPWDRHEKTYGDSPAYNRYFIGQLTELLTEYGPVFSVWFDGACGEGSNGKKQQYDWDAYHQTIRALMPDAVINVCGPDVRWCGNEAGFCRKSEWSVVPAALQNIEKIQDHSQQVDDAAFSRRISSSDDDLGSREAIRNAGSLVWYPAEVNTSIRPGWFYHPEDDVRVKPLDELLHIYFSSVGGNANFLLNIPPDTRGLFHEADTQRLSELGAALGSAFKTDFARDAQASASESLDEDHAPCHVLSRDSYWQPKDGTEQAELTLCFKAVQAVDKAVLMEHLPSGQRIEAFTLEYEDEGGWKPLYRGSVVGYKKICRFDTVKTGALRLKIEQSRRHPTLSYFGVF